MAASGFIGFAAWNVCGILENVGANGVCNCEQMEAYDHASSTFGIRRVATCTLILSARKNQMPGLVRYGRQRLGVVFG